MVTNPFGNEYSPKSLDINVGIHPWAGQQATVHPLAGNCRS